jgi:antitoxin component of RelBE/YafQ-DinJ toxin-antitoxin module
MASRTVRARLDDDTAAALRFLVNSGMTESEAVRTALIEARAARLTDEALRAECERLMQDKEAVAREMAEFREWEELSAPWPD